MTADERATTGLRRIVPLTGAVAAAALALLLLGSCSDDEGSPDEGDRAAATSVDETVRADLATARDALEAMLAEEPALTTNAVTVARLRAAGYVESPDVSLTLTVKQGGYCIFAVSNEADGKYGIDAEQVWFIGSDESGLRQAPVVNGWPRFPGDALSNDYGKDPCPSSGTWNSI